MGLLGAYLRDFHVKYEHFVGGLSIITNSLLIYLAIKKSNSHIRKYSIILIISSLIDLIFNTFSIIFSPIVEIQQGNIFLFLGGSFEHLPPKSTGIICMVYLVSIFCTVINIPMQFFYRYTAVCLNHQLTIFNYIALYLMALPVPIAHCIWGYFVFYPHEDVIASHLPILKADPVWGPDTPTFFVADQKDHYARIHFATSFTIVGACYVVVTITGLKIYLQLRKLQFCMSRGNLETQGQLTKILLIQAIIPFVCLAGPVMIGTALSLLSISIPLLGYTMTSVAMWLPVVNSSTVNTMEPHIYLEWLNNIFGFILPSYVIYLICYRTQSQHVRTYSKVIITSSILDIFYVVSNVMSMCSVAMVGHQIIFILRNPLADVYPLYGLLAYCFQIFIIFLCVLFLPVQFIYRYRVVTSSDTSLKTVLFPLLLASSYMVVHCSLLPYTFQTTAPKYDKLLVENGFERYAGGHYYVGDVEANVWLIPHLGSCNTTVLISYVFIYFYYKKTQSYLQRFDANVTKATIRAQKQMGRVMMLQALYPTVVFGLPCVFGATSPIIGVSSKYLGNILFTIVHTSPTLNALSVIICVPTYRRITKRLLLSIVRCSGKDLEKYESKIHSMTDNASKPTI